MNESVFILKDAGAHIDERAAVSLTRRRFRAIYSLGGRQTPAPLIRGLQILEELVRDETGMWDAVEERATRGIVFVMVVRLLGDVLIGVGPDDRLPTIVGDPAEVLQ
jgi:hypothetical protein